MLSLISSLFGPNIWKGKDSKEVNIGDKIPQLPVFVSPPMLRRLREGKYFKFIGCAN